MEVVEFVVGSDGDDTIGGDGAANLLAGMRGDVNEHPKLRHSEQFIDHNM